MVIYQQSTYILDYGPSTVTVYVHIMYIYIHMMYTYIRMMCIYIYMHIRIISSYSSLSPFFGPWATPFPRHHRVCHRHLLSQCRGFCADGPTEQTRSSHR